MLTSKELLKKDCQSPDLILRSKNVESGKSNDDMDSIKITGFRIFMDSEIPSNKFAHNTNSCELSDFLRNQPAVSKPTVSRLSLNVSSVKESMKERFLLHEDKNEATDSKFIMK
ncbi:hypothetical protein TNCT_149101, partial [Trichonephila clavata]